MTNIPTGSVVVMAYRTKYRVGTKSFLQVEVSNDGGFSWSQTGLATAEGLYTFNSPTIKDSGIDPDPTVAWEQRLHNLDSFKNNQIVIRFRYDRQGEYCLRTRKINSNDTALRCIPGGNSEEYKNGYWDGWWISRITIGIQ
jgi:hypothetical protein